MQLTYEADYEKISQSRPIKLRISQVLITIIILLTLFSLSKGTLVFLES